MKRRIPVLLSLLLALPLFGEATQRYMITMRKAEAASRLRIVTNSEASATHRVRAFEHVGAFAADLTAEEAAEMRKSQDVETVEPVVERHALDDDGPDWNVETTDDTPRFTPQVMPWGVSTINAQKVWPVTRGANVNVAVLDTGIDFEHPDLASGYAGGYDVFDHDTSAMDDNKHGTHVAGTIGARDNDFGVVGVAPEVKLWAVKVLTAAGKGDDESIVAGIDWVIDRQRRAGGRWVINMSLGSRAPSEAERKAVASAIEAGIVIVASSGNRDNEFMDFPAKYRGVIAAGAVDEAQNRAEFSSYGDGLSIVAPGVAVPSTFRQGLNTSADVRRQNDLIDAWGLNGSPFTSARGKTIDCKLGRPEDFRSAVKGKIAVIQRGEIPFREKARNAKEAGAIAVIVYNNDPNDWDAQNWTMDFVSCKNGVCTHDPGWEGYEFPLTVGVPAAEGTKLLANTGETVTVGFRAEDYGFLSGTSMASPHVSGAAALLLALDPEISVAQVKFLLEHTAHRQGAAWDYYKGWGIIDAYAAATWLAPSRFGVEPPAPYQAPRRRSGGH